MDYCDIYETEVSCQVSQCYWCNTTHLCASFSYCSPCEEFDNENDCIDTTVCHYCSAIPACKPLDFLCTCGNNILDFGEQCDGGINCLASCLCIQGMIPDGLYGCKTSSPDHDNDTIPDSIDLCPNTPQDELVDDNGCSNSEFCAKQPMCGPSCDNADWKDNEQNNPKDCRTVIIAREGAYYPFCAGLTCAD